MATLEDFHPLCRESVADWSPLQLAGLPILAEARAKNRTMYTRLAAILEVPLLEDDPGFAFETTAVFVFNRTARKLLVENVGVYLENALSDYYEGLISETVSLFRLASSFFLASLLARPVEAITTGVLGTNRLTEQWLNSATLSVKQELVILHEILDALGLSADRPVFVGHGANGLIVKALQLDTDADPWRVAFERAVLSGSAMGTISGVGKTNASLSTIINFYGIGSIWARDDSAALTKRRMPVYPVTSDPIPTPADLLPPHPFKTFCHIVAACGSDPVLNDLCDRAFPDGEFGRVCDLYGRPRTREDAAAAPRP